MIQDTYPRALMHVQIFLLQYICFLLQYIYIYFRLFLVQLESYHLILLMCRELVVISSVFKSLSMSNKGEILSFKLTILVVQFSSKAEQLFFPAIRSKPDRDLIRSHENKRTSYIRLLPNKIVIPLEPCIQGFQFHQSCHLDSQLQPEQLQNRLFSDSGQNLVTYSLF